MFLGESVRVVVEGGDAGGRCDLVVQTEPGPVGAADVRDEVAAVHGAGVVDGAAEAEFGGAGVLHSAMLVRCFEVRRQVQDLRDQDLVVAFSVGFSRLGVLEAREADEEDFRDVAQPVPDAAWLSFFGESFAFRAGQVDFVGQSGADGVFERAAAGSFAVVDVDCP